jgi:hypothetical protein
VKDYLLSRLLDTRRKGWVRDTNTALRFPYSGSNIVQYGALAKKKAALVAVVFLFVRNF